MTQKDYMLYGTKVLNLKTQEISLLICIWKNKFADAEIDFATCVDKQGKRYNIELDNIITTYLINTVVNNTHILYLGVI